MRRRGRLVKRQVEHNSDFALPCATASYNYEAVNGIALLVAAGRALYGERWQTPVARDLGTTYRTVRNWLAGCHPTPVDLEPRLRRLLIARGSEIEALLVSISENGQ